jgi:predicted acetyltransferase
VTYEIRGIDADDLNDLFYAVGTAFGDHAQPDQVDDERLTMEYERMIGVVQDGMIVAGAGAYSFDLTLPGATQVPVAGVTWVGVLPTHRRQGILTTMMAKQLDDVVERGEAIAILTASEAVIYGRFGYGVASHCAVATIPDHRNEFRVEPRAEGRARFVSTVEAEKLLPPVFDAWRATRVGSVTRNEGFWAHRWLDRERHRHGNSAAFRIVHEDASGQPDGYAVYRIKGGHDEDHSMVVDEVIAPDPEVEASLWRTLLDHDLNSSVETGVRPVDDQLRWRLADSRAYAVTGYYDHLWLRVLDVCDAFTARRYCTSDSLVFEVSDRFRPAGAAAGRFRLDASPDGASCVRAGAGDEPDITLEAPALGSAYLGTVRFSTLAAAGRATGTRDALQRADRLFTPENAPFCSTDF